MFFNEN